MKTKIATVLFFLCVLILTADARAASEPVWLKIIYSSFTGAYTPLWLAVEEKLEPSVEAIKTALEMMADQFPQVAGVDPQEVVDMSFVKQVESSTAVK